MWRKQAETEASPPPPQKAQAPFTPPVGSVSDRPAAQSLTSEITKLTAGISLKGVLTGQTDLYIDGELEGTVNLPDSSVTVGPNGRVSAEVSAREISVQGSIQGNLHGGERVTLGRACRVTGDVITPRLAIEEGACIHGHVTTDSANEPRGARLDSKVQEAVSAQGIPVRAKEGVS